MYKPTNATASAFATLALVAALAVNVWSAWRAEASEVRTGEWATVGRGHGLATACASLDDLRRVVALLRLEHDPVAAGAYARERCDRLPPDGAEVMPEDVGPGDFLCVRPRGALVCLWTHAINIRAAEGQGSSGGGS